MSGLLIGLSVILDEDEEPDFLDKWIKWAVDHVYDWVGEKFISEEEGLIPEGDSFEI